ncbi:hypothetical protein [Nitratireductor sp. GCM10026969]|uniref:hypothetical protein n=1 Tax=Nitratireductor sp. GCM10026969 TaxID=3252645 RepID=UPI0036150920
MKKQLVQSMLVCALLFPAPALGDSLTYKNARFGTVVTFPAKIFLRAMDPPPRGEGMTFLSRDGASLGTYAMNNALGLSPEEFAEQADDCAVGECEMTRRHVEDGWVTFSGERGGHIFHKRWKFGQDNIIHGLTYRYPSSAWDVHDQLADGILQSFDGP